MDPLDDLNKAFEAQYRQNENQQFKIMLRRDKLFALWAAQKVGLSEDQAKDFVRDVIDAEIASHLVVHKVWQDLTDRGCLVTEGELQSKLMDLQEEAREQVMKEISDLPANPA